MKRKTILSAKKYVAFFICWIIRTEVFHTHLCFIVWQSEKLFLRLLVLVLFTKVIVTVVTQWIHVISHVCLVLKFDNEVDMLDEIPLYFLVSKAYWQLTPHVYQRRYNLVALYWCMCTKVENCPCFWHLLNHKIAIGITWSLYV
jgi:hypothetical protein